MSGFRETPDVKTGDVKFRRTMNYIRRGVSEGLQEHLFAPVNKSTMDAIRDSTDSFLKSMDGKGISAYEVGPVDTVHNKKKTWGRFKDWLKWKALIKIARRFPELYDALYFHNEVVKFDAWDRYLWNFEASIVDWSDAEGEVVYGEGLFEWAFGETGTFERDLFEEVVSGMQEYANRYFPHIARVMDQDPYTSIDVEMSVSPQRVAEFVTIKFEMGAKEYGAGDVPNK